MHLTRCTSLDVLHSDVLHSVYFTLCTMLCTLDSACVVLCVLVPMYFSKGLRTEEPFAMLSGKSIRCPETLNPTYTVFLPGTEKLKAW